MTFPAVIANRAAEVTEVAGATVAAHFGDPGREYEAARHGVGLAHRSRRALFRVSGSDRSKFLQALLTSDVAGLKEGEGQASLFLDNKGHVRGALDLWVEDDAVLAGCDVGFVESVLPDLGRYVLGADVSIEDRRDQETVIAVHGAGSEDSLSGAGFPIPAEAPHAHIAGKIAGVEVRFARTPDLGTPGVEVHVPTSAIDNVWAALEETMCDFVPVCVGWNIAEVLRVESGITSFGHEISGEEFPQEARLNEAIAYQKGCYLGQETVARIHYRGQVKRVLSGLRAEFPLTIGAKLISSDNEVGRVTSSAVSPRLGSIALAYVRREESKPGAALDVRVDDEDLGTVRVVSLPFDDRG